MMFRVVESIPDDCFLRQLEVFGVRAGRKIWQDGTGRHVRYYTWDALHGEVEVFNGRRRHLGAMDPISKDFIKDAVRRRTLEL